MIDSCAPVAFLLYTRAYENTVGLVACTHAAQSCRGFVDIDRHRCVIDWRSYVQLATLLNKHESLVLTSTITNHGLKISMIASYVPLFTDTSSATLGTDASSATLGIDASSLMLHDGRVLS